MKTFLFTLCLFAVALVASSVGQTVAESQGKAEAKFPDLTRVGSPLQARYVLLQEDAKQNNPKLLTNPKWPEYLADKAAKTLADPAPEGWAYRAKDGDAKYNLGVKRSPDPANAKSLAIRVQNESARPIEYHMKITFSEGPPREEKVTLPPPGQNIYSFYVLKREIRDFEILSAIFTGPKPK